jgi:hypothetical protein
MADERYYYRRIVSWISSHAARGRTWEEICAINAALKAPRKQEWMDACREAGMQAAENSRLLKAEMERRELMRELARSTGGPLPQFPPLRICDLTGCKFPEQG